MDVSCDGSLKEMSPAAAIWNVTGKITI